MTSCARCTAPSARHKGWFQQKLSTLVLTVATGATACTSTLPESPATPAKADAAISDAAAAVVPVTTAKPSSASSDESEHSGASLPASEPATTEAAKFEDAQSAIGSAGTDWPEWISFVRESVDMLPLTDGRIDRLEWSPRGDKLAMYGWDIELGWGSFVIDADGTRLIDIDGYFEQVMSWSPDGSKVLHRAQQGVVEYGAYRRERPVVGPSIFDVNTLERFYLDDSGGSYTSFSWSPDSAKVLYFQVPFGLLADRFAVWTANADGTQRRLIDTYPIKHDSPPGAVWWSPDSSEFVFVVNTRADHQELWRARAEGSHASFLANGRSIAAGYSPDSTGIWASVENYDDSHDFLLFSSLFIADEAPYNGISWRGLASAVTPIWSDAGDQLSFIAASRDGTSHLFVDFPGDPWGEPFASGEDIWAQQSPEGTQIAYTAPTSDGAYELRIVNADRSGDRRVISGAQITARWSPDSSKIWYSTRSEDARVEIGIALVDGSSTVLLQAADDPDTTWTARWSPDGSRISYASDADGDSFPEQIWIAEADGSRSHLIADINSRQDAPSKRIQGISTRWSEDSTHLWYLLHRREPYERDGVYTDAPGVELWAVPVADREPRLVADGEYISWYWSPDARFVAYELIEQEFPFSGGVWITASNNPP